MWIWEQKLQWYSCVYSMHLFKVFILSVLSWFARLKQPTRRWSSSMIVMATKDSSRLFDQPFVQTQIKKTSKLRVTGRLWGEATGHRWIPLTKASDAELRFFFICVWINGWSNKRDVGDLRHHHAHYDVTVMCLPENSSAPWSVPRSFHWFWIQWLPDLLGWWLLSRLLGSPSWSAIRKDIITFFSEIYLHLFTRNIVVILSTLNSAALRSEIFRKHF